MGDATLSRLPVSDFEPGGSARTMLQLLARSLAEMDAVRVTTVESGFLGLAKGEWLDELARSHYQLERKPSAFAEVRLTLSAAAGLGPYDLRPGELWAESAAGLRYALLDAGTIPAGGSVALAFRAESPGTEYNAPAGTVTRLATPLPGVTVTNLAASLITAGADVESDAALSLRAALRWAERGGGATRAAYEFWALTAHPSITKVRVLDQNPRGQGTVDVIVWGEGGLGTFPVTTANDYIQARRPLTANVRVASALEHIVPVQLTVKGVQTPDREAQIIAGLTALQRDTPIGGTLYRAALIEVAMLPDGVLNAVLSNPAADVTLGTEEALTLNVQPITWVP